MLKRFFLVLCALVVVWASGCASLGRQSSVMPPARQDPLIDRGRPALVATAPTLSVPTTAPAAEAKPVVKPVPAAAKDSAATATLSASAAYRLKAGDPVVAYLRGIPGAPGGEQQIEDIIDENGMISMPYVGEIQAGGKTSTELEQTIRKAYIDQQIYRYITVNVVIPSRSYYVRGEIRQPGRFQLLSRVTVNQAIAAAGGFTEFANPSKVEILRGSQRIRVDAAEFAKHPERDKELESGDVIIVHRSFF